MKLNNNGFSLVELLAVVTIIGILSSAGIAAYGVYQVKSRNQAYDLLSENASLAAENYFYDHVGVSEVSIADLVSEEYLEPTYNPYDKSSQCGGIVKMTKTAETDDSLSSITYVVKIDCAGTAHDSCRKYPGGTTATCP